MGKFGSFPENSYICIKKGDYIMNIEEKKADFMRPSRLLGSERQNT